MHAPTQTPARRRRHACLIAAAARLIGGCAEAALAVYEPISGAPPEQDDVPVNLLPLQMLASSAPVLLDHAARQDRGRWPAQVGREEEADGATFRARRAVAEAQEALYGPQPQQPGPPVPVPLPTAAQGAAMELTAAAAGFLQALEEPATAFDLLRELIATGEFTTREILDEAVTLAVQGACLALAGAARQRDPSTAAEYCLSATGALNLIVTVAGIDAADIT
ncbi:hypothetical protein ACFV4M_26870 [Kitasatospora indigofera]|uniref:hypothetical protein n=1 Tax=Kitasatospora indigofera TaxID=67307 RepID=UPI00365326A1